MNPEIHEEDIDTEEDGDGEFFDGVPDTDES